MALTMFFSRSCLQWTVIIFNILSLIIGIFSVVACIYELDKFTQGTPEHLEKILQLVAASFLVISTFVGYLGSVNGSVKVLCCFITMLIALIISHIWKLWHYDEAKYMRETENLVTTAWMAEMVTKGAMDQIQEKYECCAEKNSLDYVNLNMRIPVSCYRYENNLRSIYPFEDGCFAAMKRSYLAEYRYERLAHALLIGFESFGILLALLLICKLLTKTRRYSY